MLSFCFLLLTSSLLPQSYHALNGSPYAGVTGMYVNPATTVNQAFKWDLTLFSVQTTLSNTLLDVHQASVSTFDSAYTEASPGLKSRYLHGNIDINLLNLRFMAGKKSALAFGLRARTYNTVKTQPFYYSDTISSFQSFLGTNKAVNYLDGFATHAGWLEADFNFSHLIVLHHNERLSAGITLGYMRGLTGAHAALQRASYLDQSANGYPGAYQLTAGSGNVMYSRNYDLLDSNRSFMQNAKTFLKNTSSAININLGFEYLFKSPESGDEDISVTNYDWKIGFSIMDIGKNKYTPSRYAFTVSNPKSPVTDTALENQLGSIENIKQLRKGLTNLFSSVDSIRTPFTISNPIRIIINIDRNLGHHWYVNGELSMNIYSSEPRFSNKFRTRELNLLTVTPRWETSAFGVYVPVQYNTQGQLWVGGAVKMGPLLLGIHDFRLLKWLKEGTHTVNGGAYLLLSIHPFTKKAENDGLACPAY